MPYTPQYSDERFRNMTFKSLFGFSRLYLIISNRLSPYFSKTDEAD